MRFPSPQLRRILAPLLAALSLAACKQEEPPQKPAPRVKRVVRLHPMNTRWIELDDQSRYGMGENLYNRLVTKLQNSERFVVVVDENWQSQHILDGKTNNIVSLKETPPSAYDPSDRLHFDFAPVPAADFSGTIEELTFTHGSRGVKRFAGFSSEFKTPFNDGSFSNQNEFTPRSLDFLSGWFGTSFDAAGNEPTGSIAGVDAGEEGEMNLVIASVHYRRDRYLASAHVGTELSLLAEQETKRRTIEADGRGFLFALGGSYKEYSAEFGIARKDALKKTFDMAADLVAKDIQDELLKIPFRTKIEKYGEQGIIVNAGRREGIRVGDVFLHKANGVVSRLKVAEAFQIGSRVEAEGAAGPDLRPGDVVVLEESSASWNAKNSKTLLSAGPSGSPGEIPENRGVHVPAKPGTPSLSRISFDPPEFSSADGNAKYALSLKNTVLLPYLLWRWSQYDQDIDKDFHGAERQGLPEKAQKQWNTAMIGLAGAWSTGNMGAGVKVAVIDSGVDYNHKNLGAAFFRDYAGFDFLSHDLKPFDDNSHGTSVAGIIAAQGGDRDGLVGIAPDAKLLSYKAFNPYGETTSAALYGAFDRAIRDGARIIVCAWDTKKDSLSIRKAVERARDAGVLVVAAAGDKGDDLRATAHFPAVFSREPNVITVASLNQKGTLSQKSGRYSDYGLGYVDIAAPGEDLTVLSPRSETLQRSGTDLAAAHVAGVAALVAAAHPEARADELKERILRGAKSDPRLVDLIDGGRVLSAHGALTASP